MPVERAPEAGADGGLNPELAAALGESGGIPVLLPMSGDRRAKRAYLDGLDGLLIAGEESELGKAGVKRRSFGARAQFEAGLFDGALSRGLPVLALGGGMQLLALVMGGELYQDLASELPESQRHVQSRSLLKPSHLVNLRGGSILEGALGEGALMVNSRHRRAVRRLGKGLVASAMSLDGVIEGFESNEARWVVGVQWHPEYLLASAATNLGLFRAFMKAAAGGTAR